MRKSLCQCQCWSLLPLSPEETKSWFCVVFDLFFRFIFIGKSDTQRGMEIEGKMLCSVIHSRSSSKVLHWVSLKAGAWSLFQVSLTPAGTQGLGRHGLLSQATSNGLEECRATLIITNDHMKSWHVQCKDFSCWLPWQAHVWCFWWLQHCFFGHMVAQEIKALPAYGYHFKIWLLQLQFYSSWRHLGMLHKGP